MVFDTLDNAGRYRAISAGLSAALDFLCGGEPARLEPPAGGSENSLRHEIEGERLFALVQRYGTKARDEAFWEAHRKYIDVQCVVEGEEAIGWAPLESMRIVQEYDPVRDFMKLVPREGVSSVHELRVRAGMFAIFWPGDAHMPSLHVDGRPGDVKKAVMKVAVDS